MRPDFSVRHSPRLTNRNGTPTRSAPPTIAARNATTTSAVTGAPSAAAVWRPAAPSARPGSFAQASPAERPRPATGRPQPPGARVEAAAPARSRELLLDLVQQRPLVERRRRRIALRRP